MIEALIAGQRDPAVLARLARGVMRKKIPELEMACDGRFTESHAQMCRLHLDAYDHLGAQVADLDLLVAEAAAPFARLIARLVTIPGVGQRTAEVIVAETGGDMTRFPTPPGLHRHPRHRHPRLPGPPPPAGPPPARLPGAPSPARRRQPPPRPGCLTRSPITGPARAGSAAAPARQLRAPSFVTGR